MRKISRETKTRIDSYIAEDGARFQYEGLARAYEIEKAKEPLEKLHHIEETSIIGDIDFYRADTAEDIENIKAYFKLHGFDIEDFQMDPPIMIGVCNGQFTTDRAIKEYLEEILCLN